MTAHLAGTPLEELVLPLLSTGGAVVLALRGALALHRRSARRTPVKQPGRAAVI